MAITDIEHIRKRLKEGYNTKTMQQYYRLQKFAFGEGLEEDTVPIQDTNFIIDFPDVRPDYLQIGKSRRILNHTFISMSKILYANPIPEFFGIPQDTAQVRRQFYRKRSTENRFGSDWSNEIASAYLDGDALGLGFVQIGLVEGAEGQRISIKHVPITQVIWDVHEKSPTKARYIAFIHYLPEDVAIDLYGAEVYKQHQRTQYNDDSTEFPINNMRIVEYFDIGWGTKGEGTYAVFADNFGGEKLKHGKNPFGKLLPFAHYQAWIPPGCKMPIGRVLMQISTQEALNELEDNLRTTIQRGVPFNLLDKSSIDPQDYETLNSGENLPTVGYTAGQGSPFVRVPGAEVPQTLLAYQSYLERVLSTESGLSDLDRSNTLSTVRSASEVGLLQQSSQIQGAWSRKQLTVFYKTLIEKAFQIAAQYDRDPLTVDVNGEEIEINNPSQPNSWIEFYLQDDATIFIDETSLDYKDSEGEKLKKLAVLQQLAPEMQGGLLDPIAYLTEKLTILGLDPTKFIKQPEAAPAMPGAEGVPPELAGMAGGLDINALMQQLQSAQGEMPQGELPPQEQ